MKIDTTLFIHHFWIKFFFLIWITFIPIKTSVYQISFVIIVGIFLAYVKNRPISHLNSIFIEYKTIIIGFGLVLVSMTISNILSPLTTMYSWTVQFHYLFRYFLMFIILLFFFKEKIISKKFLLLCVLFSLLFQGIDGIYQAIFEYDFIKYNISSLSDGLSGATFNRNNFGFFMTIGASLCTGLLFYYREYKLTRINIVILSILLFIFFFNLLFSYSRASWLFYCVFVFILLLVEYKKISINYILIFLAITLLMSLMFFYFDNLFFRLFQLVQMDDSGRSPIWHDTIYLIQQNIIFGYGLMTYEYIASQPIHSIHNSILEILLFLGVFGFIAFTFLLYLILKEILKKKNYFYLALFFAFLTITQFDNSIIKSISSLSTLSIFAFFIFEHNNA